MKRSGPPRRRTPLKRGGPLRARSRKQQARDDELAEARLVVAARSNGFCEAQVPRVCMGRGVHAHHVQRRSQGRSDDPTNLLWVCHSCHQWIHDHPADARSRQLLR